MGGMASMLTSYNLPLKVIVLAFNACVCNVHGVRNQESKPLMVRDSGLGT
jgi:hypothetical protein